METEIISAAGAVAVALISGSFLLASSRRQKRRDHAITRQIGEVNGQVTNRHKTNLRDDVTETVDLIREVASSVKAVGNRVDAAANDIREVRRHTGRLFELDREKERRLVRIERRAFPERLSYPLEDTEVYSNRKDNHDRENDS